MYYNIIIIYEVVIANAEFILHDFSRFANQSQDI